MASRTQLTRRSMLTAMGAGGLAATLGACAGPGGGGSGTPAGGAAGSEGAAPLDAAQASGEISFFHWRAEDQAVLDDIIVDFTAEYPDASVRQDIQPSNDYQSNALQQIRQGTVGDLFTAFRGAQFVDMADAGVFVDLGPTGIAERYDDVMLESGAHDGTQLGLPYQLVFNQPIANQDLLSSVGVTEIPTDWQSFLGLCDDLAAAGVTPIAWPGGEAGNAGQLFNSMIMNVAPSDDMCTRIESGEYQVTDDWFIQMLRYYQELVPYMQPNATGTSVEPLQQMFASGDAGMLATGSYHMAAVRGLGAGFPMGLIAPVTSAPGEAQYVGIHNATFILGVSSLSENRDTAYALMEFLSRPEVAGVYANGTAQHVTVRDVEYTDPDLEATADWLERETLLAPRFQFNDLDIRNAAEGACVAVVGGTSPEQAAADAQRIIDERIDA